MQNLISAQEAFNAVVAGKHVLCRAAGDMLDFDDLDQFPATIFAKSGYEFCIKVEMIELAGIAFTKPLTLDEITPGMDVFVVQVDGVIHHHKYKGIHSLIATAVNGGFAQRDFDNAKLQYEALCKTIGGMPIQANVKLIECPAEKSPRKTRSKKEVVPAAVDNAATSNDVEKTSQSNIEITAVSETTIVEDNIVTFESVKADLNLEKSLRERIVAAESIVDLDALLPELNQLHGESGHVVMSIFSKKKEQLNIDDLKKLTADAENLVEITKAKSDFKVQISRAENTRVADHLISVINERNDLSTQDKTELVSFANLRKQDIVNAEYDEKLDDLIYRASIAKTPAEANAQIRYTNGWTEEQLAPLHRAISKRLSELNKDHVTEPAPSLMRDIQNAPDLTVLDALEIDVGARAPDMQKVLMAEVVKRRFELENM